MKGMKIFGIMLGVAVMVFLIAPVASAQTSWDILDDQWFTVKLSLKGYQVDSDNETVLGKGGGSGTAYLQMISQTDDYSITTCTEDERNLGSWIKRGIQDPISIANIYGATYPELWDFGGNPIVFYNGITDIYLYPTLYIKVTTDGATLKKAKISTVSCGLYVSEASTGETGFGSCKLSGSTVPLEKVPLACR